MPTLEFKGKQFVYAHHLSVPFRQLEVDKDKSLSDKPCLDDNLIIHGDNLHALKALLPQYAGKVKCIYIDPPYNTGKDWCYNDNVNSPLIREWLKDSANPVDKDDLERHDKWLCMMWARIQLLKELLAEDGIIFVSIDDNEFNHLRSLLDELFDDSNWVGTIIWKNATDNNPTNISIEHEYIICFSKNKRNIKKAWKSKVSDIKEKLVEVGQKLIQEHNDHGNLQRAYSRWFRENKAFLWPLDRYKYIDKGGIYTGSQSVHNPGREGYRYDILHPDTGKPCQQPLMGYRFPEATARKLEEEKRFLFGRDENKIVELKVYAHEYEDKLPSVINLDGRLGAYELRRLFPERKKVFDNPKPSRLIEQILSFITYEDDIVLDSFAGSGTTAHAVLTLNKKDGGNRKFILVECEDYTDEITAERVRRVIKGVPETKDETLREGLGGSFTYCTLGDEINIESLLKGDHLPDYESLARYVFYTATGKTLNEIAKAKSDFFIGETDLYRIHLIYQPGRDFLRSNESALNAEMVNRIAESNTDGKQCLVFASAKFMGQRELTKKKIDFCQLPYAIHRVLGD